jgi:hypothetical protein
LVSTIPSASLILIPPTPHQHSNWRRVQETPRSF